MGRNKRKRSVASWRRKTGKRRRVALGALLWITLRRWIGVEVRHDFVGEQPSSGKPSAQRLDKALITLSPFGLGGRQRDIGQRRRAHQPEPDEDGEGFIGDRDVAFEPLRSRGSCGRAVAPAPPPVDRPRPARDARRARLRRRAPEARHAARHSPRASRRGREADGTYASCASLRGPCRPRDQDPPAARRCVRCAERR